MDDATRVAEIYPIDQLKHYQSDLLLSDRVFVLGEIFLEVVLSKFEDQMEFLFTGSVDHVDEAE